MNEPLPLSDKIFIGRKTQLGNIVEVDHGDGDVTALEIKKSLEVVQHSTRFTWGWHNWNSEGHAQLAAALLYEVTGNDNAEIARTYYQLFRLERVIYFKSTFEISEYQIRCWLQDVGGI